MLEKGSRFQVFGDLNKDGARAGAARAGFDSLHKRFADAPRSSARNHGEAEEPHDIALTIEECGTGVGPIERGDERARALRAEQRINVADRRFAWRQGTVARCLLEHIVDSGCVFGSGAPQTHGTGLRA